MGVNRAVHLSDAIDDFLRDRRSQDYSRNTLKGYESRLRQFLAVNGNTYMHLLNTTHVTRYREEGNKTRQPQSQRNDHSTLSVFFEWSRKTGRMPVGTDPLFGWRKPKRARKERNRVHVSRFPALLDAAEAREPRDRIAVAVLLYTLARDQEAASIRIRDVDLAAGYIHLRVFKTGDEDRMPICEELDKEIRKWLTYYSQEVGHLEPHYFLIPARATSPLYEGNRFMGAKRLNYKPEKAVTQLGSVVVPALDAIGFQTKTEVEYYDARSKSMKVREAAMGEGAHTVRRSGARALFDQLINSGVDFALEIVQSMLHHANGSQTAEYIGFRPSRHKRDDLIKGQRLYDTGPNVVQMRRSDDSGSEAGQRQSV
jgi:integrase